MISTLSKITRETVEQDTMNRNQEKQRLWILESSDHNYENRINYIKKQKTLSRFQHKEIKRWGKNRSKVKYLAYLLICYFKRAKSREGEEQILEEKK